MKTRIVILNYNGESMMKQCLPSVLKAVQTSRYDIAVTILDNGSSDGSEKYVKSEFPMFEYIHAPSNDFLCSFNAYAQTINEDAMFLLNNDLKLDEGFCDPMIEAMTSDDEVFFCAPKSMTFDGASYEGSLSRCELRKGLIWGSARFPGHERIIDNDSITMQCGFGLFRREYFLKLGGYDDLYLPGTLEDTDLCFRGYENGWKGLYCHRSICFHMGQASFGKAFGSSGITRINTRNRHLFMYKNIDSVHLWFQYGIWFPLHFLKYLLGGSPAEILGFKDAVKMLPSALKRRRIKRRLKPVVNDYQVFQISKSIGSDTYGK
ncbi:MAG: glycosyltransferase [Candidatus Omnitrophica bacterium]|nr:glycosyltransferase [Candidatus Omnitrophota bacterium]